MPSDDLKNYTREQIQEAYEYWMNQANTRTDGQRKEIASRLAAAEVATLYGNEEIYEEYREALLVALAFEEDEQEAEQEEDEEVTATAENVQEYDNESEEESEKSEQAFAEEDENDEEIDEDTPLDLVIDGENISDIKDAVRGEELSNEELDEMINEENGKDNPRSTLIDWLENRKSDEAEDDIMEIGAE